MKAIEEESLAQKKFRELESLYLEQKKTEDNLRRIIYEKERENDEIRSQIDPNFLDKKLQEKKP